MTAMKKAARKKATAKGIPISKATGTGKLTPKDLHKLATGLVVQALRAKTPAAAAESLRRATEARRLRLTKRRKPRS